MVDVCLLFSVNKIPFIYNHLIKKEKLYVSYVFLYVYHLPLMVDKESNMSYVGKSKQTWIIENKI